MDNFSLSIIVPCFNEQDVIKKTYNEIIKAFCDCSFDVEIIFVNDGSTDNTLSIISDISKEDHRVKIISFSRNFGHQPAVTAGLNHATGDIVSIMDADLQDPPSLIISMISEWKKGAKVVYAVRKNRKESIYKKAAYYIFYRMYSAISDINVVLDSGDFCLMDKEVVDKINSMPEKNRFVRGLRSWVGYRQVPVFYDRQERMAGDPKYTFSKLLDLAMDGIFNFSVKPLVIVFYSGIVVSLISLFLAIFYLVYRIFNFDFMGAYSSESQGFTTLVVVILLMGSVQILTVGIIGQYISRIYQEVKSRPPYIVEKFVDNKKKTSDE
jgi:dolichol-phosphate mannosyltransferase